MNGNPSRRFFAPEVVQTSAMDCGPAALKCLLEGFGLPVSYGRLREACQTDVDGTSIDTIEEVSGQLGLEAQQVMLPADHLALPACRALPALVVTRNPDRTTHFVVVWRRHGRYFQVMDPAIGRRWMSAADLLNELYIHDAEIPAEDWRAWAHSDDFLKALRARLARLGVTGAKAARLTDTALADTGWLSMAALDATVRMVASLVQAQAMRGGRQTAALVSTLFERARSQADATRVVPEHYWMVRPSPASQEGLPQLRMKGTVMISVAGRRAAHGPAPEPAGESPPQRGLSPELLAALEEKPVRPGRTLLEFLRADGVLTPTILLTALGVAAGGLIVEALLFRTLFDLGGKLGVTAQRMGAMAALVTFSAALFFLEWPLAATLLRYGRRLEARLRLAFLRKIPRLDDRYFQSRLISDMADRSHSVHGLRNLPAWGGRFIRLLFELVLTTLGIMWLNPGGVWVALAAAAMALALPFAMQPNLIERDLKVRTHNAALSRFYLDALLGLAPIKTHGATEAVRCEHEGVLVEWVHASHRLLRTVVGAEAVMGFAGFGLACWLLFDHLARGAEAGAVVLLVYWALNLPAIGQEIALVARQYPAQRNIALRLLEPLGAAEQEERRNEADPTGRPSLEFAPASNQPAVPRGAAIKLEDVTVRAGGHVVLQGIQLDIAAGEHLAVVGPSGAGKSSLVGLFLGWHRAAEGVVWVDGQPLGHKTLEDLRRDTAWVDPTVQLWNRTLLENLHYGAGDAPSAPMNLVLEASDLRQVLEKLSDGLQTRLGDGGALVSGGEGQRVRLGRAMLRSQARLAILDEPFRGLDRERRRALLNRAREFWRGATLICVTHDVGETLGFNRVVVIDRGRVVEDGEPADLARRHGSLYGRLLAVEEAVRTGIWESEEWRHLVLHGGGLSENRPAFSDVKNRLVSQTRRRVGASVPLGRLSHGRGRG